MRNKFYASVMALTVLFIGASLADAQTNIDLSMRMALYFTGSNTQKIDLAKDKYVADGGTMELQKSQATSCAGNRCVFNIGFIAFRSGDTDLELSTYGLFQIEKGGLIGNTVYFPASEKFEQGIFPLKLKMGMTKVTFSIDPYKKTAESDEANNSLSVIFRVVPERMPILPRRTNK